MQPDSKKTLRTKEAEAQREDPGSFHASKLLQFPGILIAGNPGIRSTYISMRRGSRHAIMANMSRTLVLIFVFLAFCNFVAALTLEGGTAGFWVLGIAFILAAAYSWRRI